MIIFIGTLFLSSYLFSSVYAQSAISPESRHMQSMMLPLADSESSYQNSILPAKYDQQLGITFVEDFVSLAYNVTAVDQTDPYGYGPAYLLNGLSNLGYWYQVGISYNWPFAGISGYSQGFAFNYQVFAPNQSSVYPRNGGGGLQTFSGPVYSGDTILLVLSFYNNYVVMYALDWDTNAEAIQVFSSEGAQYFEGSPYGPSNQNGYFTGLMTEWYHPEPYYSYNCKVTYSNDEYALVAAWMWMDEYDPYDYSWTGAWFTTTTTPIDLYQNPYQLHTLSFGDITETCNAFQFSTGSIAQLQSTITIIPASQTIPLSENNYFTIYYTLNGRLRTIHNRGESLNLNSDNGTNIIISGTSSGSSPVESWVLNSKFSNTTIAAGSDATFVYYDLLPQLVSFTVSDSANAPNYTITYFTAPQSSSPNHTLMRIDASVPSSIYQTIMVARGTTVSIPTTISNEPQERWAMIGDSSWIITSSSQIPARIVYQHQFLLSFAGVQLSWQWINADSNTQVTLPGISERSAGSGQRVSSYSIDDTIPTLIQPTTETITLPIYMNSAHRISINFVKQYQISIDETTTKSIAYITSPTIANDTYWYDQGTPVKLVLNTIINRTSESGERLYLYSVNGEATTITQANPITILNLVTISTPEIISVRTVTQYKISVSAGTLESVTNPTIQEDEGWYDANSTITAFFNYSTNLNQQQARTNAISYTLNNKEIISLNRSGNGTFPIQITLTDPTNINIQSVTQYMLTFSGGYNVEASYSSPTNDVFFDQGTSLTLTTDKTGQTSNETNKQKITTYIFDDTELNFKTQTAKLTTTEIYFDKPHELVFQKTPLTLSMILLEDQTNLTILLIIIMTIIVALAITMTVKRQRTKK
jgi:hypothetical protein